MFALAPLALVIALQTGEPARPTADDTQLNIPFQRYTVKDSLRRTVTFYLSKPPKEDADAKRPIALFIQGSGCQSAFSKVGDKVSSGLQGLLLLAAKGRVRVLVVEKPGVAYLDSPAHPGSAEKATEEFLTEHTLPRWAEANVAALRGAWTLPGVDPARTLVVGHSEGGIVAARVAAEEPKVTHVASLAGGGPTQLFDFVETQGQSRPDDKPGDADKRVKAVYDEWAKIQADPNSVTKFWLGHPYRRWASFFKDSTTEELLRSKAKVYLAHGTLDSAVPVKSFDIAVAELRAKGRDLTAERVTGGDHGFSTADTPKGSPDGFRDQFNKLLDWFLPK